MRYIIVLFSLVCTSLLHGQADGLLSKRSIYLAQHEIWSEISENGVLSPEYRHLAGLDFFEIRYLSEGHSVRGYAIEPKVMGEYPLVVFNRGGNRDFAALSLYTMIMYTSRLAAEGYVILASNYRDQDEFGGAELADVLALIDLAPTQPKIDPSRMGMLGWSRGGMMTYLALAETMALTTAVIGNGPTDLFATLQERPGLEEMVFSQCIPTYWENKEDELRKRSVIYWPERLDPTASLLLIAGTQDRHVSHLQAQRLHQTLSETRSDVELRIVDTDHFFSDKKEELHQLLIEHFNRQLKE